MENKILPIDYNDPMNGIVKYFRTNNKIDFISVNATSYYTSYKPASYLLQQQASNHFQLKNNKIGEYFEIHFLNGSAVSLTGYGFMAKINNCAPPRNWNVSCVSTNPPTLLANEVNNNNLCPEGSSSGCTACSSSKKKAYEVSNKNVYCTDIRFTTTGPNAYGNIYYFALSGIELFGTIGSVGNILGNRKCTCLSRNIFRTRCVFIYFLVHFQ